MRRLMILMMILMMANITVADESVEQTEQISLVASIVDFMSDIGTNILEFISPPVVRIPNDVPKHEVKCLADNIYFEAKSEPYEGKLAVATVTINRVEDLRYPKTVCAVVWQQNKDRRTGRKVAQFSWTLDGKPDIPKNKTAYEEAYYIAEEVLLYGTKSAIIGTETLFYHANYVKPRWARQMNRVARIGNHIFYQPKYAN